MKKSNCIKKLAAAVTALSLTALPLGITAGAEDGSPAQDAVTATVQYTYVAAVPATCTAAGIAEHYTDGAGNNFILSNGVYTPVSLSSLVTAKTSHTAGSSSVANGYSITRCSVCGEAYSSTYLGSVYRDYWGYDYWGYPLYYYYGYPYYYDYYYYYDYPYYYDYSYYYDYPYYYSYYYPYGYNYTYPGDPYYYYFYSNYSTASSSSKEAEYGTPYVNGKKTNAGWDTAVKYIKKAKTGDTVTVNMNGAGTLDSSVLSALKGKDVELVINSGAQVWKINGRNVSSAQSLDLSFTANTENVPEALKAKAGKDAFGTAEFELAGSTGKLGCSADITLNIGRKYIGSSVELYRYDPVRNVLVKTDSAAINSKGKATLTVKSGGAYLMVIK